MAYDYAIVHLTYTIPLAALLTFVLRPLLTRLDLYKTAFLVTVAFVATLPWDAYLIHRGVWTYPPEAILGPRLLGIPAEELFFFVIQTYITSMFYILLNKPLLHAQYLTNETDSSTTARLVRRGGQAFLLGCTATGAYLLARGGETTYLGLILVWACPFALLTWTFSGYFVLNIPRVCVVAPIIIPTVYLWVVDELALGRGTWSIESGTKLGWCLFGSLELEEAIFFLATNILITFGLVAFDRGVAIINTFPNLFPDAPALPSPLLLVRAFTLSSAKYEMGRVRAIREAVATLRGKSRSFYLASSVFSGRLRIDLVLLYAFCRVADDLVDDCHSESEALDWIQKLSGYLDLVYASSERTPTANSKVLAYIKENFPKTKRSALELLPADLLPQEPLYELLEGFKMDLSFSHTSDDRKDSFPIKDDKDLEIYATRVASTVGELCLWLVFHHDPTKLPEEEQKRLLDAARTMGHALQYVNIARDISVDAQMDRVYLPTTWLKDADLSPRDVIKNPTQPKVDNLREKLLDAAFKEYRNSRPDMDMLPPDVQGPLVVAVESYMEIGRVLREKNGVPSTKKPGRATVPRWRRIWVAWKSLSAQ